MPIENIEDAKRSQITVQGVNLTVPAPFVEGHVLRVNEAAVLNQTYAENLRNNFASNVKKAKEAADKAGQPIDVMALQAEMDKYVDTYDFGVRRSGGGGGRVLDPVEREAMDIARNKVKAALKGKGYNLKDVGQAKINDLAADVLEKYPQIREQAQQIVSLKSQVGLDSLDISAPEVAESTEDEADEE